MFAITYFSLVEKFWSHLALIKIISLYVSSIIKVYYTRPIQTQFAFNHQ